MFLDVSDVPTWFFFLLICLILVLDFSASHSGKYRLLVWVRRCHQLWNWEGWMIFQLFRTYMTLQYLNWLWLKYRIILIIIIENSRHALTYLENLITGLLVTDGHLLKQGPYVYTSILACLPKSTNCLFNFRPHLILQTHTLTHAHENAHAINMVYPHAHNLTPYRGVITSHLVTASSLLLLRFAPSDNFHSSSMLLLLITDARSHYPTRPEWIQPSKTKHLLT